MKNTLQKFQQFEVIPQRVVGGDIECQYTSPDVIACSDGAFFLWMGDHWYIHES